MTTKLYELHYLLPAILTSQDQKTISEKVVVLLQNQEAIVLEEKTAVQQELAYPMKGQSAAWRLTVIFRADSQKIPIIEAGLNAENKILRFYLLTTAPASKRSLTKRRTRMETSVVSPSQAPTPLQEEKKVELKEIDEKLKEIFGEQ